MFLAEKSKGEVTAKLEPWRQLLLDGANEIEKRGHAKGIEYNAKTGGVCLMGAVHIALTEEPLYTAALALWFSPLVSEARNQVYYKMRHFLGGRCPVTWNNAPERTASEVTSAMRACARQGI